MKERNAQPRRLTVGFVSCSLIASCCVSVAQHPMGHEDDFKIPDPIKQARPPEGGVRFPPVLRDSEAPSGLDDAMLQELMDRQQEYVDFALRFTCDETVTVARYGDDGAARSEKEKKFAYFLVRDRRDGRLVERRPKLTAAGEVRPGTEGDYKDDSRFPPPYAWLSLFSRVNEPFMTYRHVAERLEGFEIVHEIQFRGALPFTDGKDVREWEGTILVDAVNWVPLSIIAEPSSQSRRIRERFDRYVQAVKISIFGVINFATRPRPWGFRIEVDFDHQHEGLRFPTRVRFDRFEAVKTDRVMPRVASVRTYDNYRFTRVETEERLGRSSGP